jgi:hypothetical protein
MGYYINKDSKGNALGATGKIDALLSDGAKIIGWQFSAEDYAELTDNFPKAVHVPDFQENMVVVVANGTFEAAGYAYSPEELTYMSTMTEHDKRPRVWLSYEHAAEVSGYNADH